MKKNLVRKILSTVSAVAVACVMPIAAVGCYNDGPAWTPPKNTDTYDIPQDYYRTYYEVFVRSFSDGNGDGIGDLKGLINNLDYLNDGDDSTMTDLGVNGIWLMPIHPTQSYHGYDVKDYKDINPDYGTLDDFDKLVEECNKRDIWIQIDLVLNHTSNQHPWFKAAVKAAQEGKDPELDEDMQKYSFIRANSAPLGGGKWHKVSRTDDYYYLGNFASSMPDVNLANDEVREEIKSIVDFWLERGVKSFRLDAVPYAFGISGDSLGEDNLEFWTWFNDYCNEKGAQVAEAQGWKNENITRYCYNVGEVWSSGDNINKYFTTGMSNFNYSLGASADRGYLAAAKNGLSYAACRLPYALENSQKTLAETTEGAILSNFLSNHDNGRVAGFLNSDPVKIKQAAGLCLLSPGNPYIYYGDELGALGSGRDENKRLSFNWGDSSKGITKNPGGSDFNGAQTLGSWKSQTNSENSILTYYRNAIRLRNRFPEIGRGIIKAYYVNASGKVTAQTDEQFGAALASVNLLNKTVAVYTLTWKDRTVLIAQNVGTAVAELDISEFSGYSVVGELKANGGAITLSGSKLALPVGGVAVLKA